ncbi:MAG TPA: response regulator transcription factor [Anaerolineae bacterium]|nr:response regulator transcription factor [Anaerolineae bacterium]
MPEGMATLVVDDEEGIRFFLEETLRRAGHVVQTASSGEDALEQLRETRFDLVLLDLILGGRVDGLRVLEAIRWRWPDTIVIILTAHGSLDSALSAIREGVDGYLLKPVEPEEVRQAVQEAVDRRKALVESETRGDERSLLERGRFCVDLRTHDVVLDGAHLELTPREFGLLIHLMENAHRVVGAKELVHVVQGYECEHQHEARRIIKWYVHRLRRKVEPTPSIPRHILTVRGVGYRFVE